MELLNDLDELKALGKDIQLNESEVRDRLGHYVKRVRSAKWPEVENSVSVALCYKIVVKGSLEQSLPKDC